MAKKNKTTETAPPVQNDKAATQSNAASVTPPDSNTPEIRVTEGVSPEQKAAEILGGGNSGAAPNEPKRKGGWPKGKPRGNASNAGRPRTITGAARANGQDVPLTHMETPQERAARIQREAKDVAPLVQMGIGAWINRRTPDMPYTIEEAEAFTGAAMALLEKYFPDYGQYSIELSFITVCGVQFGLRYIAFQKQQEAMKQNAELTHVGGGQNG